MFKDMRFSIITVTRNNLAGLQRTGESVKSQTCADYEWVVVDGASDDGSVEWLKTSGAQWRSEPDHGIYDAMNKGIEQAQGDYVIFLNAGDGLANQDTLEKLAAYIGQNDRPLDFIYGDALEERPGQTPACKAARPHTAIARGMFTHHQAMLYRRKLLGSLRFDTSYEIAADYKFTALFLRRALALYCPFPVCLYEAGGVSQVRVVQGRKEQFYIRRELNMCGNAANHIIYALQGGNMLLRRAAPSLYWRLKSRRRRG